MAPAVRWWIVTPPKPSRRRLTQAEFDAEAARAKGKGVWCASCQAWTDHYDHQAPMRTRTGRRRSWWQRGWKR